MRTIKFRGKASNGKWVYGSLTQGEAHNKKGEPFMVSHIAPSIPVASEDGFELLKMDRVYPETVGQFTGMKDRKGNEVYEGDILMVEGIKYPRYHIVSWDERKFMFCIDETPLYAYLHGDTLLREYVVCGSVFDHPDLIEKGGRQ